MALTPISFGKFVTGWLPVLAVTASVDPAPALADIYAFQLQGVTVPPVTCALSAAGVLIARPLARRSEAGLSWPMFLLVSLIMLVVVQLWVIESRPGALFAFVVSVGLGFSGYSLIELVGQQVRSFVSNIVSAAAGKLGGTSSKGPASDA